MQESPRTLTHSGGRSAECASRFLASPQEEPIASSMCSFGEGVTACAQGIMGEVKRIVFFRLRTVASDVSSRVVLEHSGAELNIGPLSYSMI